jgi:hypothetical protein
VNWPTDADGDVLRSLKDSGFDFAKPCLIDFNVDFDNWPPSPKAVSLLSREYPSLTAYEPEADTRGYLLVQVFGLLTYELVTHVQESISDAMAPFGGRCDSWGVLHRPT